MAWDSMEACRLRGGAMGAGRAPTALLYGRRKRRGSPACAGHDTELRRVAADALVSPRALTNDLYGQSNARGCPGPGSALPVALFLASMLRILVVPQPALATGTSQPSSAEAPRTAPHTGRRREPAAYYVGATQAS